MRALTLHTPDDAWCVAVRGSDVFSWLSRHVFLFVSTLARSFSFDTIKVYCLRCAQCVCVHVTAVSHINYKPNTVIFVKKTVQRLWQWQVYFTPTESCLHSLSRRLFFFKSHNGNAEKIIIKTPAIDKYERESVKGTINGKRKRTEQKLWNPVIYGGENKNKWRISLLRSHRLLAS